MTRIYELTSNGAEFFGGTEGEQVTLNDLMQIAAADTNPESSIIENRGGEIVLIDRRGHETTVATASAHDEYDPTSEINPQKAIEEARHFQHMLDTLEPTDAELADAEDALEAMARAEAGWAAHVIETGARSVPDQITPIIGISNAGSSWQDMYYSALEAADAFFAKNGHEATLAVCVATVYGGTARWEFKRGVDIHGNPMALNRGW